jgi:hypothetical protein
MARVTQQDVAVFGESGSGKTVLVSSFFGATQEPSFDSENLYKVVADDTGQGTRLRQNYLKMKNAAQAPDHTKFAATRYSFVLKPRREGDAKHEKSQLFSALRLVWHDYPGEWFEEDPSSEEEAARRAETFRALMTSDVAILLVDGQKLLDYAGDEEKYLKSMLWGIRAGLEKLKDDILPEGKRLRQFPRIWVLALSKADLHPQLDIHGFQDLLVEKAAGDIAALLETLKGFVEFPEALSLGDDFMLLSSAQFEPGRIELTKRVGLDLILPVACMLPMERVAQWADKFEMPLKVVGGLVNNAEDLAVVLTGGARFAAKFLTNIPRVGPILSKVAVPALLALMELSTSKLQEIHAEAIADKDYLTATLAQFRLDLDEGAKERLLVKSPW